MGYVQSISRSYHLANAPGRPPLAQVLWIHRLSRILNLQPSKLKPRHQMLCQSHRPFIRWYSARHHTSQMSAMPCIFLKLDWSANPSTDRPWNYAVNWTCFPCQAGTSARWWHGPRPQRFRSLQEFECPLCFERLGRKAVATHLRSVHQIDKPQSFPFRPTDMYPGRLSCMHCKANFTMAFAIKNHFDRGTYPILLLNWVRDAHCGPPMVDAPSDSGSPLDLDIWSHSRNRLVSYCVTLS